jgi:hypothetical protein
MSSGPHKQKRGAFTLDELRGTIANNHPRSEASALTVRQTDDERVYDLALAGNTPKQIAVMLQKQPEEVEALLFAMAERSRQRLLAEMSVADIIDVDRITAMLKAIWPACEMGELTAIDRAAALIKERRKILKLGEADLTKSIGADVDLSLLDDEELVVLERIQRKLAGPKTKAAPVSGPIIDAEVVSISEQRALPSPSPKSEPSPKPKKAKSPKAAPPAVVPETSPTS